MRIHKGSGRQFHGSGIKVPEYSFQRIRFKLCALLAESRSGWYGRIQSPEIKHFNPGGRWALWNEKGNKFLGRDFFASLEIGIGMDSILWNIRNNVFHRRKKQFFDFVDGSWSCASLRKWYTTNSRAALATSTNLSVARAAAHFAPYVNPLGSFFEKIWVRPTIRG